jgi:hypothetical protein
MKLLICILELIIAQSIHCKVARLVCELRLDSTETQLRFDVVVSKLVRILFQRFKKIELLN